MSNYTAQYEEIHHCNTKIESSYEVVVENFYQSSTKKFYESFYYIDINFVYFCLCNWNSGKNKLECLSEASISAKSTIIM